MIRKLLRWCFLLLAVPSLLSCVWFWSWGWPDSYRDARWSSSGLGIKARDHREAIVQVYSARAGRWKGVFGVHTWIVLKPRGASRFERYEVVGWGRPVRRNKHAADAYWFGNTPHVVREVRGPIAARAIPRIRAAIARYPANRRGDYRVWPGPNSNSFVAWVARQVPELGVEMPPTAVGKDYLGPGFQISHTPSDTGWQVTYGGIMGAALAREEGLELHIFGATLGIDPNDLAIKLPGIGRVGPFELWPSR